MDTVTCEVSNKASWDIVTSEPWKAAVITQKCLWKTMDVVYVNFGIEEGSNNTYT